MNAFVKADSGLDVLIWLVVIFFWGVGQLIKRAADTKALREAAQTKPKDQWRPKPAQQPPRPPPKPEPAIEEQLQDFLRSLGAPALKPVPAPAPETRPAPPRTARARPIPASKKAALAPAAEKTPSEQSVPLTRAVISAAGIQSSPLLVNISGIRMPSMKLGGARPQDSSVNTLRPEWENVHDLRRAMISHVILGPPVSLR